MKNKTKRSVSSWGFDPKNLDTSVRPQNDFFHFAAGGWIKRHPIPPTKAKWGTFYVLREDGLKKLRALIEEIADSSHAKGTEGQIIRDFYLSGMDTKTRNKLGLKPLEPFFRKIDAIKNGQNIIDFIAYLHKAGFSLLWGTHVGQDDKDSEHYTVFLAQSGLTLPDRDFYLKKDPRSETIRDEFLKYIEKMLVIAGEKPAQAREDARVILELETKLARFSMSNVDTRDIEKVYNRKSVQELGKLAPAVEWRKFFETVGIKNARSLVVLQPEFISKATALLAKTPLDTWKKYLRWHVLNGCSPLLSTKFISIRFQFFGKVLMGSQKPEPVWKRVIGALETYIGEAVGKEYVKRHFPPEAKKKIDELVDNLFAAYEERLKNIDWMSPATKKKALAKLAAISRKLGYPSKWKSYKGLDIRPDEYFQNAMRALRLERRREIGRYGKKVDRTEWFMTPQTVNAYYSPNMNEIAFPAGILQPPFFDPDADAAINYGAIGSVIGHEITHGFDDQGSKFDGRGNFKNWWTADDRKRFDKKANVLVKQFNGYKVGDINVNGKLTLGENIADLGGAVMAYYAYMRHLEREGRRDIAGFTPEQRFFLGLTLVESGHQRPEAARTQVMTDPHSPAVFRINGPTSNMTEFYEAFGVTKEDRLYRDPKDRAKIW
ncbi:MAG TPA: M13 family metallopeptidase [Candidatus Paceibacterota bacterium]|jgi:putative endopeptidase|nr:M13 family metallopeptidase [Candidatus Paceibacterota bacterium]